jgi:putative flippase GtrA
MARLQVHLASRPGRLWQGVRYILVGGLAGLTYLLATTILVLVAGMQFEVALAIGYCFGIAVHFTLQRVFVWGHRPDFAFSIHHQVARYLAFVGMQYGVTAACTALFPRVLGLPTEVVYLVTVALLTGCNFVVYRHSVFRVKP